jgi:activator of 2-hydroxyglutaryl-CoA dehydratase
MSLLGLKIKEPKVMENITFAMALVIVGAFLSAIGAFWASYLQNQKALESATQRAEFETELRAKSDELAKKRNLQLVATEKRKNKQMSETNSQLEHDNSADIQAKRL